ncbi:uncharacterized protein [Amphiura filiformis]|uniref:uncharacterized protein n=1 Tax=Amphiura filiformis TaxID=82378 RepID=UPI003B2261A8
MKMPSNYVVLLPVALLALLSLRYTVLADSYECQDEDDVSCAKDILAKCIRFGNSYSNRCGALCHVALENLNGNMDLEKRAQRRKQNKNLSNLGAMQLLPMRKRDVSDVLVDSPVNTKLAQALGLPKRKRDTHSALETAIDKRVDKTIAQQLGLLKKRAVDDVAMRSTRAIGGYSDTCAIVLEEVATRLVGQQPQYRDHE